MKRIKFVGLDVHAETIAVAVAEQVGNTVPGNDSESRGVGSEVGQEPGPVEQLRFCYVGAGESRRA
jgi:hypothetical protein